MADMDSMKLDIMTELTHACEKLQLVQEYCSKADQPDMKSSIPVTVDSAINSLEKARVHLKDLAGAEQLVKKIEETKMTLVMNRTLHPKIVGNKATLSAEQIDSIMNDVSSLTE